MSARRLAAHRLLQSLGALVLLACEARPVTPREGSEPTPLPAPPADPTPPPPAPEPADQKPASQPGPLAYAASSSGVLLAWSRHDGEHSKLVAQTLDPRGAPRGRPQLVLHSYGEIVDLAIDTAGGGAWIAYVARLESETTSGLVGAVAFADDLSATASPLVLERFTHQALDAWPSERVRVHALGPAAAIVATLGAAVPCRDRVLGGERDCPGYHLFTIDGPTVARAARVGVDGGQSDMGALVDVGAGHLLDVWAWHGGPSHADLYLPRGAAAAKKPRFRRVPCRPPFRRGFDGHALVSFCREDAGDLVARCRLDGELDDDGACDRFHAVDLGDRLLTPRKSPHGVELTARQLRCHEGHPVLDLAWSGGQRRLDPQASGAALDLRPEIGVWTGELSVRIDPDGRIARFRCDADQLVEQREAGAAESVDLAAAPQGPFPPRPT